MFDVAKERGYDLEKAAQYLKNTGLAEGATYKRTISVVDLEAEAKAGRFALVNVKSGGKSAHALGIEGYSATEGFLIHDPWLSHTYYQKPAELQARMVEGVVTNIVK